MRYARPLAVLGLVAVGAVSLPWPAAGQSPAGAAAPASLGSTRPFPEIFGSAAIFSPDNSAFYKWNGMLARFALEQRQATHVCAAADQGSCWPAEWQRLVDELRGLDLRNKLIWVNAEINRHPYVPSMRNWGESNHWETPFEFFRKSGQCQDYAIAKYLLLRAAGVDADRLRIVVLRDLRLGLDHAVLVAALDDAAVMLDNQLPEVVLVDSIRHYQPYYAINEEGWWLERPRQAHVAATMRAGAVN